MIEKFENFVNVRKSHIFLKESKNARRLLENVCENIENGWGFEEGNIGTVSSTEDGTHGVSLWLDGYGDIDTVFEGRNVTVTAMNIIFGVSGVEIGVCVEEDGDIDIYYNEDLEGFENIEDLFIK